MKKCLGVEYVIEQSWAIQYGSSPSSIEDISPKLCWVAHPESKAIISIYSAVSETHHEGPNEDGQKVIEPDAPSPSIASGSKNADEIKNQYIITASEDGTTRSFMLL